MKKEFYVLPCGQEVTLFRTHFFGRTFSDALFKAWTVVPSVGLVSKLTTKLTKPAWTVAPFVGLFSKLTTKPTENQRIFDS
jgi:hypothetical protein